METRSFACPPRTGETLGLDLAYLNPANPDDRRVLILAEHPELQDAVENEIREIELRGQTMNPLVHITLHEAVANQLWDDNPPEAWRTAQRLLSDPERYDAALRELPMSWEDDRPDGGPPRKQPRRRATGRPKGRPHGR